MSKKKNRKTKKSHRIPLYRRPWAVALFLVVTAVIVWLLIVNKPQVTNELNQPVNQPTASKPTTSTPQDEEVLPEAPAEPEDKTTQYEGGDPNLSETLSGYIARKGVDDNILTVVAVINQYLHETGRCTITLKNNLGQTVYNTARNAVADVTTSICDTFEVPVANLPQGSYKIEITLNGDNKQGVITDEVAL